MSDLVDLLLKSGDLEFDQIESARGQQQLHGGRVEHILIETRMIPERTLVAAIARVTQLPVANLDKANPDGTALARLPDAFCWENICFPTEYDEHSRTVTVAVTDPTDIIFIDGLIRQCGCRVKTLVAGVEEIRRAIRRHYRGEWIPEGDLETDPSMGQASGDEFKITDMSGNTVMTSLKDLKAQHDAQVAAQGGGPPGPPLPGPPQRPPPPVADFGSASTSIDDLFAIRALSPAERERVEKVQGNVEKSQIILRAIMELLEEKGYVRRDEITQRTR
ncbi:MAG: hypothetical protein P1V51_05140 [Deltaproteobacteria bacterium]|nr:hypothetical protein [Deltaproteobacteria bacterium]